MTDGTVPRGVGATTALSGLGLLVAPRAALRLMGAADPDPAPLLYRVVGMFMTVCGGLLLEAPDDDRVRRWMVVQKAGAVGMVVVGTVGGQYRRRALAVAAFDAASAVALLGSRAR